MENNNFRKDLYAMVAASIGFAAIDHLGLTPKQVDLLFDKAEENMLLLSSGETTLWDMNDVAVQEMRISFVGRANRIDKAMRRRKG